MNSQGRVSIESAIRTPRPDPRIGSDRPGRWLVVISFCYLLSGQAFGTRDPLGTSVGWDIYAELSLFLLTVAIVGLLWAKHRVPLKSSHFPWSFLSCGLLALLSSVRSFWPPLSIVKGCLFCLVLVLAKLLCDMFSPAAILIAIYYGVVSVYTFAILIGLAFPETYPLTAIGESDRQRLALFTYTHGDFAYMTGVAVFIGRLPAVRAPWYFQALLAGLTVASGSRACTLTLIVIWVTIKLCEACDLPVCISVVGAAAIAIALFLENGGTSVFPESLHNSLQTFYGSDVIEQSPWDLSGRVELWQGALGILEKCAFLGYGFDGARDQLLRILPWAGEAHNGFLELLLAAGGLGLLSFLAGCASAIRSSVKSKTGQSALSIYFFLVIVASTGTSFTIFQYFGVFLILCVHNWTFGLSVDESGQPDTRGRLLAVIHPQASSRMTVSASNDAAASATFYQALDRALRLANGKSWRARTQCPLLYNGVRSNPA